MTANHKRWLGALVLLLAMAGAALYRDDLDASRIEAWVHGAGLAGPAVFVFLYALGTVLAFPGILMTFAGGALFGPWVGSALNLAGATLGATFAFFVARHLLGDWVRSKTGGRLLQLVEGVEREGWRFVAFTRLVPVVPFNILNYALGLTRIGLVPYVVATAIFMIPACIAYTWLGYAGREALSGSEDAIRNIMMGIALIALVAFLPRLVKRVRAGSRAPERAG